MLETLQLHLKICSPEFTWYKLRQWLFSWNSEPEEEGGSIVFTVCQRLHFLKYKESTIITWGKKEKFGFKRAAKRVNAVETCEAWKEKD